MSSGSGGDLEVLGTCGCSPNARQIRCTIVGRDRPTRPAIPARTSAWRPRAPLPGWHDHLLHLASRIVARHARPGLIAQPVQPPGQEPAPPLAHRGPADPQPRGTAYSEPPSAQASTIFARSASPWAVFRRFAQFSSVRRSASDSTSGSSLLSPMPPADRGPTAAVITWLWPETKNDSRGEKGTQDRDTRQSARPTAGRGRPRRGFPGWPARRAGCRLG